MCKAKQLLTTSAILVLLLSSCVDASENFLLPAGYADLIKPYASGDSLKFRDSIGNREYFIVETLDSSISYPSHMLHGRRWKDIRLKCRLLNDKVKGRKAHYNVTISKCSCESTASIELRLKSFYNMNVSSQFNVRKDTVRANDMAFTDYYLFHTSKITNDPDPVVMVYMKAGVGIIAYRTISGAWWTRYDV